MNMQQNEKDSYNAILEIIEELLKKALIDYQFSKYGQLLVVQFYIEPIEHDDWNTIWKKAIQNTKALNKSYTSAMVIEQWKKLFNNAQKYFISSKATASQKEMNFLYKRIKYNKELASHFETIFELLIKKDNHYQWSAIWEKGELEALANTIAVSW